MWWEAVLAGFTITTVVGTISLIAFLSYRRTIRWDRWWEIVVRSYLTSIWMALLVCPGIPLNVVEMLRVCLCGTTRKKRGTWIGDIYDTLLPLPDKKLDELFPLLPHIMVQDREREIESLVSQTEIDNRMRQNANRRLFITAVREDSSYLYPFCYKYIAVRNGKVHYPTASPSLAECWYKLIRTIHPVGTGVRKISNRLLPILDDTYIGYVDPILFSEV